MGSHFKMIPSQGIPGLSAKVGKCIASKVEGWVGGQKILLELYDALVAVYIKNMFILFIIDTLLLY